MDTLMLINAITMALLFSIWSSKSWINVLVKMSLFTLMLANILRLTGQI